MIEAIVGHLVGDYLCQPHWMALGKKHSSITCGLHCLIWTACVCSFAWGQIGIIGAIVLFMAHFVQDRSQIIPAWMGLIGQARFRDDLGPWSSIVVDNVWHIVTIYFVFKLGL